MQDFFPRAQHHEAHQANVNSWAEGANEARFLGIINLFLQWRGSYQWVEEHKWIGGCYKELGTNVICISSDIARRSTTQVLLSFYPSGYPTAFAKNTKAPHYHKLLFLNTWAQHTWAGVLSAMLSYPEYTASSLPDLAFYPFPPSQVLLTADKESKKKTKPTKPIHKQASGKGSLSVNAKSVPTWFWNYRSFHSQGSEYPLHPEWLYHIHRL